MDHLPSPSRAEYNQRRKLEVVPPVWPVVLALVLLVTIVATVSH